ncbi:MAG: ATP-dependent Clp protease ATP-binding subunit [Bacilli bacterium]|nr:ATP-dependent Clp protease ATP-binding subunit [Bacilli bacterium]
MNDMSDSFIDIFNDSNNFIENNNDDNEINDENQGFSILKNYSEELVSKNYITNPAIARDEEIKKIILILLSPEKSVVLTGKAGIGKTAIVEGLSYKIKNKDVPNALLNSKVYKINTSSLLGTYEHDGISESKLQLLINEIIGKKNIILFIDEIHTLVTSARNGGGVDFLNMLKPGLDRGDIKLIGATTTQEFEEYLLKDKAFLRRFEKVEISEPDQATTVKILMGTRKKIEASTGVKFPYSDWILEQVCKFIVNMTSEYKRVYENGSRYPDVSLSLFSKCFTFAKFENSNVVTFKHIYEAIKNTNLVYDDVVKKELPIFKDTFSEWLNKEGVNVEI